jgi:hypothetical protein
MARHTNKRKNSRRRQTRGRRTQKGGFSISGFFGSTPNDDDIKKLQQKLNMETDPVEKANIQEELSIAQAKQIKDRTVKQIRERGATESNMGNLYPNKNLYYSQSENFDNSRQYGTQRGGSRRRRRRHRRK